jgi:poly-beta-hydroxyalkanoate depolymerase
VTSPYRTPDRPRERELELDVSPAVVVLTVAAIVATILLSRENPSSRVMVGGGLEMRAHPTRVAPLGTHHGR